MLGVVVFLVLLVSFFGAFALMGVAQWDIQVRYSRDYIRKYTYLTLLIAPFIIGLTWVILPPWTYMITPIVYMAFHTQSRKQAVIVCAMLIFTGINTSADSIRSYAGIEYQGVEQKI